MAHETADTFDPAYENEVYCPVCESHPCDCDRFTPSPYDPRDTYTADLEALLDARDFRDCA